MNRFEIWLWENELLADTLITVFLLAAMALAGWIDSPLINR